MEPKRTWWARPRKLLLLERPGGGGRSHRPERREADADLIVVGNKGMHRRVLSSIPNSVSHNASCDVLIVQTT